MFTFFCFFILFLNSCENTLEYNDVVLARVGSKKLYFKDLPKNIISPNIDTPEEKHLEAVLQ